MDITLPLERANKPRLTNGHRSAKAIDDNQMDQHEEFPLLFFLPTADDDASAIFPFYIWRAFPLYMRIFSDRIARPLGISSTFAGYVRKMTTSRLSRFSTYFQYTRSVIFRSHRPTMRPAYDFWPHN